jgi:hypothetical protein
MIKERFAYNRGERDALLDSLSRKIADSCNQYLVEEVGCDSEFRTHG